MSRYVGVFFFFQAEDGIRDVAVTGVQTCALPICQRRRQSGRAAAHDEDTAEAVRGRVAARVRLEARLAETGGASDERLVERSEERRVGKECRSGWWPYQ